VEFRVVNSPLSMQSGAHGRPFEGICKDFLQGSELPHQVLAVDAGTVTELLFQVQRGSVGPRRCLSQPGWKAKLPSPREFSREKEAPRPIWRWFASSNLVEANGHRRQAGRNRPAMWRGEGNSMSLLQLMIIPSAVAGLVLLASITVQRVRGDW
jgi:hypothetical protein